MIDSRREQLEGLVGPVSRETLETLEAYAALVLRWAPRINLIGLSTAQELWQRHILDSAQLIPLVRNPRNWVDLGSGAGFPGLVVAILTQELQPATQINLIESNRKKASFLRIAAGQLGLTQTYIHAERIESALSNLNPDIISARALASLRDLLWLARRPLGRTAVGLFHKGRDFAREVSEADSDWRYHMVKHDNRITPDSVILEVSNLRPRPEAG